MEMLYCPNCEKAEGFKRNLGFGTLFMVVLTSGLWLLVIPFMPKRCIACGIDSGMTMKVVKPKQNKEDAINWMKRNPVWTLLIIIFICLYMAGSCAK